MQIMKATIRNIVSNAHDESAATTGLGARVLRPIATGMSKRIENSHPPVAPFKPGSVR
jgi:hypothetical protein